MPKTYLPVFTTISADITDRWKLIRMFIESWHKITIPKLETSTQIVDIEQRLGLILPSSFRQYIELSTQLLDLTYNYQNGQKSDAFSEVFRDCFEVELLEKHDAISLMIQGEADFYWAIKRTDLHIDDPKIYGYILDYDSPTNDKFDFIGEMYPTITSFVLNHLFSYLQTGSSSGFGIQINNVESIYQDLKSSFTSHAKFDETEIFESENRIAFIQKNTFEPDSNEHTFGFHICDENKKYEIPALILEMAKKRGWSYGNFIQHRE